MTHFAILSQIYPGSGHSPSVCASKKTKINNLAKLELKVLQDAVNKKISQMEAAGDGPGPSTSETPKKSGGERVWTHREFDHMKQDLFLSDRKALKLARNIR